MPDRVRALHPRLLARCSTYIASVAECFSAASKMSRTALQYNKRLRDFGVPFVGGNVMKSVFLVAAAMLVAACEPASVGPGAVSPASAQAVSHQPPVEISKIEPPPICRSIGGVQ